eukprot:GGOE01041243.1.p1 GENE.GGOE01041243.1~~GGOE01041243.1.p1  ORF type:complete len:355 (-),score=106.19 GGOE01041243.1:113-1177(-)
MQPATSSKCGLELRRTTQAVAVTTPGPTSPPQTNLREAHDSPGSGTRAGTRQHRSRPPSVMPDLVDMHGTSGPGSMACPFASMGCPTAGMSSGELQLHLTDAASNHLELLCLRVHQNGKLIAEQQELIEKLMQRSPLEVDAAGTAMFKTVAEALLVAEDGDRIVLHEGCYLESLVIEKRVTLQALGSVTIENSTEGNVMVIRTTCRLSGLTLKQHSKNFFCIRVMGVDNCSVIEQCDVASDYYSCIQIDSGCNPIIRNNRIHDSRQCGVLIKKNGKGLVHDNDIFANCLSNVYVDAHADPVVTGNRIHHSKQHGIWVKQHGMGLFEDNTLHNNEMSNVKIEEGALPTIRNNFIS